MDRVELGGGNYAHVESGHLVLTYTTPGESERISLRITPLCTSMIKSMLNQALEQGQKPGG